MYDSYMHVYGSDMDKRLVGWFVGLGFTALSSSIAIHTQRAHDVETTSNDVDATSLRRIDVSSASLRRHVPAGYLASKGDRKIIRYTTGNSQSNHTRTYSHIYCKHSLPLSSPV